MSNVVARSSTCHRLKARLRAPATNSACEKPTDSEALAQLVYETIHRINAQDYSSAQLQAWAPKPLDRSAWKRRFAGQQLFVAEADGRLLGMVSLSRDGYIDSLFVHHAAQGQALLVLLFGDKLSTETFQLGINADVGWTGQTGLTDSSTRFSWISALLRCVFAKITVCRSAAICASQR